jgi:glycosyltransferase involved in cell wall biosynthesis
MIQGERAMASLSVVIPAYNEEDGIAAIVERVQAVQPSLKACGILELEVIVVDDGSQDRTCEIVTGNPDVRLVKHEVNRGYGAALKTGFRHARGDLLAFLDADGTYPPECFPQLCQPILEEGADLVIGSRMTGTESEMPLVRRVGNTIFATLVSLLGNHRISDSASGMRVFRQEVLAELYPLPDGLNFTPVMSTRALHERIKMVEAPITYSERVGRSKLSVVRDGLRFANSIVWTAMSYNPVRVLGMIGVFAVFLAVAVGIGLVALRLQGVTTLGHWGVFSVYTALVMGVLGVSLFSLGAMFNYLVSLFHKRPVRQGLFGKPIFTPSLDHHFGWMGLLAALSGVLLGGVSFSLGLTGWDVTRLWLYLLGSALLVLVGMQLTISWLVMRVLEDLSEREIRTRRDLEGA